jgi:hypothetical protein
LSFIITGCAMALVVRCQPVTAEAWVGFKANQRGTFVGQSGTDTGVFPSTLAFPCQYHSTTVPHSSIHHQHYTSTILETESAVK